MKTNFKTIDEYIAACPGQSQGYVQKIRKTIHVLVPDAREKISYQIGAFEWNGKNLISFAGWRNHVSIYPIPPGSAAFNREVAKYTAGRGTLKFPLNQPLPIQLISRVVKYQLKNVKQAKKSKSGRKK